MAVPEIYACRNCKIKKSGDIIALSCTDSKAQRQFALMIDRWSKFCKRWSWRYAHAYCKHLTQTCSVFSVVSKCVVRVYGFYHLWVVLSTDLVTPSRRLWWHCWRHADCQSERQKDSCCFCRQKGITRHFSLSDYRVTLLLPLQGGAEKKFIIYSLKWTYEPLLKTRLPYLDSIEVELAGCYVDFSMKCWL